MNEEYTNAEDFTRIRQEHIVNTLYGGNDQLALEEKERILMNQYPGWQFNFHSTTLDKDGKSIGDGHVRMHQRVRILEHDVLFDRGLIRVPLC